MAPPTALAKGRKTDDDFILTISDNEDDSIPDFDAEILAKNTQDAVSKKKRKRGMDDAQLASQKQKKQKRKDSETSTANGAHNGIHNKTKGKNEEEEEEQEEEEDDEANVIWGAKNED